MASKSSGAPYWFSLHNYSGLSSATLREWLVELTNRKSAFRILRRARSDDRVRQTRAFAEASDTWNTIREVGSLTRPFREAISKIRQFGSAEAIKFVEELNARRAEHKAQHDAYLIERGEPPEAGSTVTRLTKGDVLMRFLLGGELETVADEVNDTDSFPHGVLSPMPMDRIGNTSRQSFRFLKVDLLAPDAIIKKELDAWLASERQRQASDGTITPRLVSDEDFVDWCRFHVVPFLDLTFAAEYEGFRLTQERIGNLLFPDEPDVSLAERIRKVTRPKALSITSDSFIAGMRHQLEQESGRNA